MHPPDGVRAGLGAGHLEHRGRRIHRYDLDAASCEHAGKRAGTATNVEHGSDLELFNQRHVHVEIAAVGIERVIDLSQPGIVEDCIGHQAIMSPLPPRRASISPCSGSRAHRGDVLRTIAADPDLSRGRTASSRKLRAHMEVVADGSFVYRGHISIP